MSRNAVSLASPSTGITGSRGELGQASGVNSHVRKPPEPRGSRPRGAGKLPGERPHRRRVCERKAVRHLSIAPRCERRGLVGRPVAVSHRTCHGRAPGGDEIAHGEGRRHRAFASPFSRCRGGAVACPRPQKRPLERVPAELPIIRASGKSWSRIAVFGLPP